MKAVIIINHNGELFIPIVKDGITWATERKGSPGKLSFTIIKDSIINFQEGDEVLLKIDDVNVFCGFVFVKKRDSEQHISVTAYDQLRYLKNKDTFVFEDVTASEIIVKLAAEFILNVGEIEDTKFIIESQPEDNTSLFDMIYTALDTTITNTGEMYILYDDVGKLTLKNLENMQLDLLIDSETAQNFDYKTSIDDNTYNTIKISRKDSEKGNREIYVLPDMEKVKQWGVLQYTDTFNDGENGEMKAENLLKLYNAKTRSLKINSAIGDIRVRGGSLIAVSLELGDIIANSFMLVEKVSHNFKNEEHFMDLTLIGGDFIG